MTGRVTSDEPDILVVGEGGVWRADGHGEQQHVLGVGLARQRGEQVLRFLGCVGDTHTL